MGELGVPEDERPDPGHVEEPVGHAFRSPGGRGPEGRAGQFVEAGVDAADLLQARVRQEVRGRARGAYDEQVARRGRPRHRRDPVRERGDAGPVLLLAQHPLGQPEEHRHLGDLLGEVGRRPRAGCEHHVLDEQLRDIEGRSDELERMPGGAVRGRPVTPPGHALRHRCWTRSIANPSCWTSAATWTTSPKWGPMCIVNL